MPTHRTDDKWHWAIGAATLLILGLMASVVVLELRHPTGDHTATVGLLLGLIGTTVASMLALLKSMDNAKLLDENTQLTTDAKDAAAASHKVAKDTNDQVTELSNGLGQEKLEAAVRKVLTEVLTEHLDNGKAGKP